MPFGNGMAEHKTNLESVLEAVQGKDTWMNWNKFGGWEKRASTLGEYMPNPNNQPPNYESAGTGKYEK